MDQPQEYGFISRRGRLAEPEDIVLVLHGRNSPPERLVCACSNATNLWLASIERRDRVFDGDFQTLVHRLLCRSVELGARCFMARNASTTTPEVALLHPGVESDKGRWMLVRDYWPDDDGKFWRLVQLTDTLAELRERRRGISWPIGTEYPAWFCGLFGETESELLSCLKQEREFALGDYEHAIKSALHAIDVGYHYAKQRNEYMVAVGTFGVAQSSE